MTKWFLSLAIVLPALIGADPICPGCGEIKQRLGPIYHQIYSHVLNDNERQLVESYTARGMHPYEAINVLLRAEQRRFFRDTTRSHVKGRKYQSEILHNDHP